MIIEYIRYKINEDQHVAFLGTYSKASKCLDQSQYCLAYELTQCEDHKDNFVLRIEWTSTKDHLEGFRKSKEFKEFFVSVKPFYHDIQEMNHYKLIDIKSQ